MSRAASEKLTALEHLHELWLRLMGSVVVMFVGGGIAYVFRLQIINFLQRPLGEQLYYTSPMGSFQFIMQACLLVGITLALPSLIYNVLRFIEPAFAKRFSRRFVLLLLVSSLGLAAIGVAFGYYLTLPFALKFFKSVGTSSLRPLISVNEYFSFILGYLATFAVVFQLPLLLLFVNYITPFKPGGLTKWRKYLYVGAFAISLLMPSSPDPLSQVSLAIPIIVLYEFSVLLIWAVNRKKLATLSRAASTLLPELKDDVETIFADAQEHFSIAREQATMAYNAGDLQPVPVAVDDGSAAESESEPQPAPAVAQPPTTIRRNYQRTVTRRPLGSPDRGLPPTRRPISDFL